MIVFSTLLALLATAQLGLTSPVPSRLDYAVKESHNVPPRWSQIGEPHPSQLLKLNIGLKPNNVELLKQRLHEGSFSQTHLNLPFTSSNPVSFTSRPPPLWPAFDPTRSQRFHAANRRNFQIGPTLAGGELDRSIPMPVQLLPRLGHSDSPSLGS